MKSKTVFSFCAFFILLISTVGYVSADHGSGVSGGGGCSGDCTPPTLGQFASGLILVDNGISVNGESFEVLHFKQDMDPQTIFVGEPVNIVLSIYEDSGPQYLSHVNLVLGMKEQTISGVKTQVHNVEIIWEQTFEGDKSTVVTDSDNLISDVVVSYGLGTDAYGNTDKTTELSFEFTPLQKFDTGIVLVQTWDYNRNSWTNHFYDLLVIDDAKTDTSGNDDSLGASSSEPKIPSWFKNNAGFWAHGQINDDTFITGIKYLIDQKIITIPNLQKFEPEPLLHFIDVEKGIQHYIDRYYNDDVYRDWFDSNFPEYTIEEAVGLPPDPVIPDWIKNNAKLWDDGMITDQDFLNGIEFLIGNGIILF